MQEKHLFEYAVIRVVPRVEREEFINVGVILYCSQQKFLQTQYLLDTDRLKAFSSIIDITEVEERLCAFANICEGNAKSGAIGKLPIASRFRWLTSTRSTIMQLSNVHPGLCIDPLKTLDRLFDELVK